MAPADRLGGRLLVATPALGDPNFSRTVVLVLEHGGGGAIGVVLNRPGPRPVADILPAWGEIAATPPQVFWGGPVDAQAVICLGRGDADRPLPGFRPLFGGVGTVDVDEGPQGSGVAGLRVFSGYAGWGEGQVEAEIAEGAWLVLDARDDDLTTPEPGELWRTVLRRQPGRLSWMAGYPADPSAN